MSEQIIKLLLTGTLETLQMTVISTVVAMILGIPLGVILVVTSKGHILENLAVNKALGVVINATRSVPFIILMVAIIPFTRMIAGTSIGTTAACVPLTIAAIPFLARLVETSIKDINFGVVEAAQAMGASVQPAISARRPNATCSNKGNKKGTAAMPKRQHKLPIMPNRNVRIHKSLGE